MLAGISTASYYPALLEDALQMIADVPAQATEIFINSSCELDDAYLNTLRRACGKTQILSLHPFTSGMEPLLFFSDYKRRFYDGIELYKRFFHAAGMLGAKILVFHGNRRESVVPYTQYFDAYGELALAGAKMGVTLAQENVPRCTSWQPEFFREMARCLPDAKFVMDVKQCIRADVSPQEMLRAMGPRLIHLHVSDHDQANDCLPVGEGVLDLPQLLCDAAATGFDGGVILEVYRSSYREYLQLKDSYHKIFDAVQAASSR